MSKRNSIKKSKGPVEPEVEEAKGHNPKEDAAVGSISHILRTLFRGLYEDEAREKAEAEEQEKLQAEQDAKAQKKAKKKGKAKKGAKTGREAAVEDDASLDDDDDDGAVEHGDAPWFDASHLKDVEHTKALAARRQDAIAARLGRQQKQADGLLAYMGEQIRVAAAADEEEERSLKKRGLLVSAHIPQAASQLELTSAALADGGHFSAALVTAADLIEANRKALARRSGNMEAAGVTSKASAVLATGAPGYFKLTATNKVRQKLALQRSHGPCGDKGDPTALTLLRTSLSAPGADEGSGSATTARPRRPDVGASVEQQDLDLKVLTRMEQKLHFLRNPRYDAHNPNHQRRLTARPPSPRRIGRETYAETDPAAIARREALDRDGDGAEETQLRDVPLVIVEPREVAFSNHVVGGAYEQALSIKNASAISRRLRLLRPRTKFFTVASVKWPGARDSGNLAPGMSLRVLIRFEPDSLADYEDELRVVSEIGEVSVRLRATRDPPVLTLPDQLDVGACHLGGRLETSFAVTNAGGPGRFRLLREQDYPSPVAAQRYSDTMRLLPYYTVKPTSFDLGRDETTQIRVTFAPDGAPGEHRANFLLIGDDCRVVTHVLVGRAEAVEVTASDLDGVDLLADASYAPPDALGFESLPLGASATHEVSLLNRGELPLAFDWRVDEDAPDSGFTVAPVAGVLEPRSKQKITASFSPSLAAPVGATAALVGRGVPRLAAGSLPVVGASDREGRGDFVDVEAYKFAMRGAGHRVRLDAAPRCVALPCALGLGNVYELDEELVTLSNPTGAPVEWFWGAAATRGALVLPDALLAPDPAIAAATVEWEPSRGVLGPGESVECMMRLDATRVGSTDLALPCFVVDRRGGDPYESCRVVLNCETSGGRLRFAEPEVDLGLIAVGAKKEHVITFTNATSGDLEFSFAEVADAGLGGRHSGSQKSLGGRSSSKASDGRKSKSDASNGDGENNEFKIDSPYCQLMFDPPVGTVGPRGEASVRVVCSAGKLPQRLRAHARVDVRSGRAAAEPQFMSLRGEVQAPKVYLTETDVDLGVVYVGVPVTRSLRLVNLSNLSTRFKWERPGGASSTFDLGFSPPSDVLDAKQVCDVTMTFCALSAGVVDEVLGCRIFGMSLPLGFTLKAISKAAVLAYELLPDGAEPPPALADAALPQLPEGVSVPSQPPPPKLDFGAGVPLFERKTVRLAIRNLSAIAAKFSIAPKKYPVAKRDPAPGDAASAASGGTARGRRKPILDDSLERTNTFTSVGGRAHNAKRRVAAEDSEVLGGGNGVAFSVSPAAGVLVPWGVLVVTVTAYNNMAGLFTDALECDVESVPASRLPIRLSVRGCPLTLRPECAGLDLITSPERPILNFGQMCVGSPQALAKHVRVRNSGPVDALLTWRVVPEGGGAGDEDRAVDVAARYVGGDDPVRLTIKWHEQVEYDPPFTVDPPELKVPAHGDGAFVVRLRPDTVAPGSRHLEDAGPSGTVRAMMVADALWVSRPKTPGASADLDNEADGPKVENRLAGLSLTTLSTVGRASGILKKANDPRVLQALKVVLDTKLVRPRLQLEKAAADGGHTLRFKTWSTTVIDTRVRRNAATATFFPAAGLAAAAAGDPSTAVARSGDPGSPGDPPGTASGASVATSTGGIPSSLHRRAMLRNVADIPLTCSLDVTSPFSILTASSTSFSYKGRDCLHSDLHLLPRRSLNLDILFSPPPLPPSSPLEPAKLKYDYDGELIVRFSTGQEQRVALQGTVVRPALVASPPAHDFKVVRTDGSSCLSLFLSNPTEVDIEWQLRHVPRGDRVSDGIDGDNAPLDSVDDPSVFDFSDVTAHMTGPSLPLKSAAACVPKDFNRLADSLFSQTVTALTWKPGGGDHDEAVTSLDAALRAEARANPRVPLPVTVTFKPKRDVKYCSRFRFDVHKGEPFDIVLQGVGSYEENVLPLTVRVAGNA